MLLIDMEPVPFSVSSGIPPDALLRALSVAKRVLVYTIEISFPNLVQERFTVLIGAFNLHLLMHKKKVM